MIVIADSNEQATSKRTIKELKHVFGNVMISKLPSGDVNIIMKDGSVFAVERKEVHDFLGSIADGRVFKQVENMASNAKYYAIIIEGSLNINYDTDMVIASGEITKWKGSSVRAALFAIMWSGCPVSFAPQGCYAETVLEMVNMVSKDDEHLQRSHRRTITFPQVGLEQDILMAFPNVGFVRSESLLSFCTERLGNKPSLAEALAFGSALKFINNKSRPKGWGASRIDDFREILGLKENEYLEIRKVKNDSSDSS